MADRKSMQEHRNKRKSVNHYLLKVFLKKFSAWHIDNIFFFFCVTAVSEQCEREQISAIIIFFIDYQL